MNVELDVIVVVVNVEMSVEMVILKEQIGRAHV